MNFEYLLNQILDILKTRYQRDYKNLPPRIIVDKMKDKIATAFWENKINFQTARDGKLDWFFIYSLSFRGDFNQMMMIVSDVYCPYDHHQKKLMSSIHSEFQCLKKIHHLKQALINIDLDDYHLHKLFEKKGELTAIELLGKVKDGLKYLKAHPHNHHFKIRLLRKADLDQCIKLDIESHVNDPTSRMRKRFREADAIEFQKPFYKRLVKNKEALVATFGKNILGVIGFFIFPDISHAMIACIFVNHQYKGQGASRFLYQKALQVFKEKNCQYYLGNSTTKAVLELAKKLHRIERSRAYVLKL